MNGDSVCFSRKSDEWETPQWLFDQLDAEFSFGFDAAATRENSKCGSSYGDKAGNSLDIGC
jgi:site-specific DNA-methyltransferase (adenine-specific)